MEEEDIKEYIIFLIAFVLERHIYISVTVAYIDLLKLYPRCMESIVCMYWQHIQDVLYQLRQATAS